MNESIGESGFEEIKVKLPAYLAKWLREFSKAIAMTPDQLLTHVLTYYYEAYEIGKRKALEEKEEGTTEGGKKELLVDEIVEKALESVKGHSENVWLIREFIKWLRQHHVALNDIINTAEEYMSSFLEAYARNRNLKKSSVYTYKRELRLFIKKLLEVSRASKDLLL